MWAERVIEVVTWVFSYREYETVAHFERYLPQIYICADLIEGYQIKSYIAARLLHHAGSYLQDYARYEETERFFQNALQLSEKALGSEHLDTAAIRHDIGTLYRLQGREDEAEQLYRKALDIFDRVLEDQPYYKLNYTTAALNSLGGLYRRQKKYQEAMKLYNRALCIYEEIAGSIEYLPAATVLQNIALLYHEQGEQQKAEQLYKQVLSIFEKWRDIDIDQVDVATAMYNLALLYDDQERYQESEELYKQSLEITEKALGMSHPSTIRTAKDYIQLLRKINRHADATALETRIETVRSF